MISSNIVLELKNSKNNPRNSEGSFITLKNGHIMYAFSRYYGKRSFDEDPAAIATRYSSDGGKTWTKRNRILVSKNEGKCNVMSVSFLRLNDGRIALFYLRKNSRKDCRLYMRTSSDEGKQWSSPTLCIIPSGFFVVNNDRVIQLENGRIIIPASFHDYDEFPSEERKGVLCFYYSDNNGKSWNESKDSYIASKKTTLEEAGVLEMKNGKLWSWARTTHGYQWELFSQDNGNSWTKPKPSRFRAPRSPMSVKRIPLTGDLLAIWNDHHSRWGFPKKGKKAIVPDGIDPSWGRTPLAMAISKDEGKSWRKAKLIEDDPDRGFCYTAIHFVDNIVLLSYCCGGAWKSRVLQDTCIRRLTLDWLYS